MARLSLSNIDDSLLKRLKFEAEFQKVSLNLIVNMALDQYFQSLNEERKKQAPLPEVVVSMDSPENKEIMKELKALKEAKQKEVQQDERQLKSVLKEFNTDFEAREFARRLNQGYSLDSVLVVDSMLLVDALVKYHGFKILEVRTVSNIPLKKVRILGKTAE
jgi:hypothetical protein